MEKLKRSDLYSLEQYAEARPEFRARVIEHKKDRRVPIGPHATLYFEDRLTIQYQIQEMLRIERIFEAKAIEEELDAYNPLIPDGSNWKATFMMEYSDPEQRKLELGRLLGIEEKVWARVDGFDKVHPICDEDLERATEEKTSSVHFLRFELTAEMAAAARNGAPIGFGIEHEHYAGAVDPVPEAVRVSLAHDLE